MTRKGTAALMGEQVAIEELPDTGGPDTNRPEPMKLNRTVRRRLKKMVKHRDPRTRDLDRVFGRDHRVILGKVQEARFQEHVSGKRPFKKYKDPQARRKARAEESTS